MAEEFIERYRKERREIDQKIRDLVERRAKLDQFILEVSATAYLLTENIVLTQKNRKHIAIWGLIREMLREAEAKKRKGIETREIYSRLCDVHGPIKYATVRSHLHRLKAEGKIHQKNKTAPWRLCELKKQQEVENDSLT